MFPQPFRIGLLCVIVGIVPTAWGQNEPGAPSGAVIHRLGPSHSMTGFPVNHPPVDAGLVKQVGNDSLIGKTNRWKTGQFTTGTRRFAVRFTSGAQAGREILILSNTETQIRLEVGDTGLVTSGFLVEPNDRFEIFPVHHLGDLFGSTLSSLKINGGATSATADLVSRMRNGVWESFFFNTSLKPPRWVGVEQPGQNFNSLPLLATEGLRVTRRTGKKTVIVSGAVPRTKSLSRLPSQATSHFAYPFPASIPLNQLNFGGPGVWARGNSTDTIQLLESNVWVSYFQTTRPDWRKMTAPHEDQSARILAANHSFLVTNGGNGIGRASYFSVAIPYNSGIADHPAQLGSTLPPRKVGLDINQNGYSDIWEAEYGKNLDPRQDLDGDGASNFAESLAGTDPNSGKSALRFSQLVVEPNADGEPSLARMNWNSVAGKRYDVEVSFDMEEWILTNVSRTGNGKPLGATLDFTKTFPGGGIQLRRWKESDSWNLDILRQVIAEREPDQVRELAQIDIPQTDPDEENFGQQIRGWIVPPATGNYTFWIAGDDQSELWLSTGAKEENKRLIASVPEWTSYQEWTKFTQQRSRVIELEGGKPYFIEVFNREGGGGDHLSVAWTGPTLDKDKELISSRYVVGSPESIASRVATATAIFFRLKPSDVDSDNDGISDAEERALGYDPLNPTTTPRVEDLESVLRSLKEKNVLTVGAPENRAYELESTPGRFTIFRSGNISRLTIRYTVSGTAESGIDYKPLSGTAYLPVGATSVSVDLEPLTDSFVEPAETVILRLSADPSYEIATPASSTVTIDDAPDQIFVAQLRPDKGTRSGGWGTASLRVAGNGRFANLAVSLGGLTTAQRATEFFISSSGDTGTPVLNLPTGQIALQRWDFTPVAGLSREQIITALENGRLWARVNSARFPNGEILGKFEYRLGFKKMPVPPEPPALPTGKPSAAEAARFLTQATFGPTSDEIAKVQELGFERWLDNQLSKGPSLHLPYVRARRAELLRRSDGLDDGWQGPRQEAWWQRALTADDQLRQRVAFALSQIMVVSDVGVLEGSHEGITNYYDMLVKGSFGNFRALLQNVTLSPIMGQYLSMIRNRKPDPITGSEPDENYAREVMQLFTIGLNELHTDGSLKLSDQGMPIPTYTQADIVGLAHVFTGWGYYYPKGTTPPNFFWGETNDMRPMVQYPEYHDRERKIIVGGKVIKKGQNGETDLKQALDTLFRHPNVGPFISRQLIQRLVTSNPSPGYIYRVASVFNNNGKGVRGDLKATVKAVLLDYEARSPDVRNNIGYGKLKEPVLRISQALRACQIEPPKDSDNRLFLNLQYSLSSQAPLKSPSVFNFFQPGYIQPGKIALAGLYSPEFQITSETTVINQINMNHVFLYWGMWTSEPIGNDQNATLYFNVQKELSILSDKSIPLKERYDKLMNHLSMRYLYGKMTPALRTEILEALNALPEWFDQSRERLEDRAEMAIYLVLASPEYAVQR